MERLTEVITDVFGETRVVLSEPSKNSICNGCLFPSECDRCSLYKAIKKLNDIDKLLSNPPRKVEIEAKYKIAVNVMELRFFLKNCEPPV